MGGNSVTLQLILVMGFAVFVGGCHFGGRYHYKSAFDDGYKAGYNAARQGRGPRFPFFWNEETQTLEEVADAGQ